MTPLTIVSYSYGHSGKAQLLDAASLVILESGLIFYSILLGITLVVAEDAGFTIFFVVIAFHQIFEGLALSALLASLPRAPSATFLKSK
jgi:zinc transporter 1/2/3